MGSRKKSQRAPRRRQRRTTTVSNMNSSGVPMRRRLEALFCAIPVIVISLYQLRVTAPTDLHREILEIIPLKFESDAITTPQPSLRPSIKPSVRPSTPEPTSAPPAIQPTKNTGIEDGSSNNGHAQADVDGGGNQADIPQPEQSANAETNDNDEDVSSLLTSDKIIDLDTDHDSIDDEIKNKTQLPTASPTAAPTQPDPWTIALEGYKQNFPFTMQSPNCSNRLALPILEGLARAARLDWEQETNQTIWNQNLFPDMEQAEWTWYTMLDACHGPLPSKEDDPELAANLTLRAFWQSNIRCGEKKRQPNGTPFSREWCLGGWVDRSRRAFQENALQGETLYIFDLTKKEQPILDGSNALLHATENLFLITAKCALKVEFPIVPSKLQSVPGTQPPAVISKPLTNREKWPGWRPERVILLSLTVGPKGAPMGCKLLGTAYSRGWEVVLIEGTYRGIRRKYNDALEALKLIFTNSTIRAEDTLVIFADSMDMLVQQSPDYVIETFLDMTGEFAFSSEANCFPMYSFPHSLGVPGNTCGKFPKSKNHYDNGQQHRFANTGGWIGVASSAFVVLHEMSKVIENEGPDDTLQQALNRPCTDHGTDQLLGNAAHLKDSSRIGLDSGYNVFGTGAWKLMDSDLSLGPLPSTPHQAYCNIEKTIDSSCPAFLHFNGGAGSDGGKLTEAFEVLTSNESLNHCCKGSLLIAQIDEGILWAEDFETEPRWATCRSNNSCVNDGKWQDPSSEQCPALKRPQDIPDKWAAKLVAFKRRFPFSFQSQKCTDLLTFPVLEGLGRAARLDWQQDDSQATWGSNLYQNMADAEQVWHQLMDACHGPLHTKEQDPNLAANLTLRAFWQSQIRCANGEKQPEGFPYSNEWCIGGWESRSKRAFHENLLQSDSIDPHSKMDPKENIFVITAKCALKLDFPTVSSGVDQKSPPVTNRERFPGWRPKRAILLSLTVGDKGAPMGCKLVSTAYTRGWEVVLVEGVDKGIRAKYPDARKALELVLAESTISADDTLVVFADSNDVLVQQAPTYVIESYLNMEAEFVFSSEANCHPMSSFPHSLGIPDQVCERFPKSKNSYENGRQHRFANTDSWMGTASSAYVVLNEMASVIESEGPDGSMEMALNRPCSDHGTEQLLGNVAYLKDPSRIGLDSGYNVFGNGAWKLLDSDLKFGPLPATAHKAFCNTNKTVDSTSCPAFLHFNGAPESESNKQTHAYERLTSENSLNYCCYGKLWIAHIDEGRLGTADFEMVTRWASCRSSNVCLNNTTDRVQGVHCPSF